jgi:hypothetical protein
MRLMTNLILKFLELETQAPKQETKLKLIIQHLGAKSAQGTMMVIINKKQLRTASNKSETRNERKRIHKEWKLRGGQPDSCQLVTNSKCSSLT